MKPPTDARPPWSAFVDSMTDPVIVTDAQVRITHVNPAFSEVYGYRADEVMGADPSMFNAEAHAAATQEQIVSAVTKGKPWEGRILQLHKGGAVFTVDVTVFAARYPTGQTPDARFAYASIGRAVSRRGGRSAATRELDRIARAKQLTPRQCEVLELLVLGRTGPEIARALQTSERTVRFHISNVLDKLEADSRSDLLRVLWFL